METTTNTANTTGRFIRLNALTEEQQDRFVEGWENAGGYMGDLESSAPWCAPWYYRDAIIIQGSTPEEWGAHWWNQCKPEIERILQDVAE